MKVIVFMVRGLQAAYLGCYGNQWAVTPTIDGLAAEGVVFDQHYAECPQAEIADLGWSTGCYHLPFAAMTSAGRVATSRALPAILQQNRIPAMRVGGRWLLEAHRGVGWKEMTKRKASAKNITENLGKTAADALKKLSGEDQWLLCVESTALLSPWRLPAEFRDMYFQIDGDEVVPEGERAHIAAPMTGQLPQRVDEDELTLQESIRFTYGGAVSFVDDAIGQVLAETEPLLDDALLIVTSDRGLPLGEHGWVGESLPAPHEELIHIPLIIRLPRTIAGGRRVSALTQPVDLYPTILERFGLKASAAHGSSLSSLCQGRDESIRPYACSGMHFNDSVTWALRTPRWGLIVERWRPGVESDGVRRLYVKPEDRWEVNDVAQHHPDQAQCLADTLGAFIQATRDHGPIQYPELHEIGTSGPI